MNLHKNKASIDRREKKFGTKAEVLDVLRRDGFRVPDVFYFSVNDWKQKKTKLVETIQDRFANHSRLAVRSSSGKEDRFDESNAGAFSSVLHVEQKSCTSIKKAVETVCHSYANNSKEDQILIQPMVENIEISGVVMTRCMEDGAPYYVINYDDESGKTDAVTGGEGVSKTVFVFRGFRNSDFDSQRLLNLLRVVRQLETFFGKNTLDIEFCIDSNLQVHTLQVRQMCTTQNWQAGVIEETTDRISFVEDFLSNYMGPRPGIYGASNILGVMPDWNPAEIIGVTPRPMASSLYRYLITRRIWSLAREKMGYRLIPPEELMITIAGRPYIDVRNSFNSFLPEGIERETGETLVNAWMDRLRQNPEFHDKVEFEIAQTIYDFNFDKSFKERYSNLLSHHEKKQYIKLLKNLTKQNVCCAPHSSLAHSIQHIKALEKWQKNWIADKQTSYTILAGIKELLEVCKRLGTLPFSVLARHAFIAETLLRSAVQRGALTDHRLESFRRSISTISSQFSKNTHAVIGGEMGIEVFTRLYGHLRPGTYDILSSRYTESIDLFLGKSSHQEIPTHSNFRLKQQERIALKTLLKEAGMTAVNVDQFLTYAREAIESREYAKFVFSKNLSDAIELLGEWGSKEGLSKEEISWLRIDDILDTSVSPVLKGTREHFLGLIEKGQRESESGKHLKLGYLIRSIRDVYVVPQHRSTPNFVTNQSISKEVVHLNVKDTVTIDVQNRIVCIENADPGYDWLFTRGIAGLITQYGGTNSHMTIRCSEYGIPAAIGCGELLFKKITSSKWCELDAEKKSIRV